MLSTIITTTLLLFPSALAHTWLEQLQLISPNGSYTGDAGYPRGYMARTDPGFNGYSDKWQLPIPDYDLGRIRINDTDRLCHPAQRTANYTSKYPKLQVAPDTYVAMRYLENGHVTQPWIPAGKPAGSGSVFVYGTYLPSVEEKIADVLQWTSDGKGGNGQGFLMTAQNFDDGRCHQPNSAPISINRQMDDTDSAPGQESWCETDLHIPQDSKTGTTLTLYWVWSWQTSTMTEGAVCGKDEYYTTCADVDIVDNEVSIESLFSATKVHTIVQQDPQLRAVSDYKSRTAYMTAPNLITTEGCSITSVTTSSLPATLTQMTTLPPQFWATFTPGAAKSINPSPSPSVEPSSSSEAVSIISVDRSSASPTASTTVATMILPGTVVPLPAFKFAPQDIVTKGDATLREKATEIARRARLFIA